MTFLFGSERSTLVTNIAGEPLKIPSESNVMLYQLTRPVAVPSELAAAAGVGLSGSIWFITVFRSKKTLALARGRVDPVDHARPIDRPAAALSPAPREIA